MRDFFKNNDIEDGCHNASQALMNDIPEYGSKKRPLGDILNLALEKQGEVACQCCEPNLDVGYDTFGVLRCTRDDSAFYIINFVESLTNSFGM